MNRYGLQLSSIDEMLDRTTALADAEAAAIEHNSDGGVIEDILDDIAENDEPVEEDNPDDDTSPEPDGVITYEGNGPALSPNEYPLEPRMELLDRMVDSGSGFEVVDGNQESTAPEETPTHPANI